MNGAGLASLISGMQQGYSFADEMARKKKGDERQAADDAFKDEQRGQQRKEWNKSNSYDDEVKQLTDSYFPQQQAPAAAPAPSPAASPAMAGTGAPPPVDASMAGAPASAGDAALPATAGTGAPPAPSAPARDPMSNTNNTLDFAIKRALIDVKHGKMDGGGLITMQKMADGMRSEKMDQAISLMNQGRLDEAINTFNSTGEHSAKLISAQDGVFEQDGVKVPTKIVTIQDGNGATRTINTAQALFQRQSMDKIIAQAQTGQQHAEATRHNQATEAEAIASNKRLAASSAAANAIAAGNLKLAQNKDTREAALLKNQTPEGQLAQIEAAVGPLSPVERKTYMKKVMGLGANKANDEVFVNDLTKTFTTNNPTATAVEIAKFRDGLGQAFSAIKGNAQVADALSEDFGSSKPGSAEYADTHARAKTQLRMTDAQLASMGYPPPGGGKQSVATNGTTVPNPFGSGNVAPPTWQSPTEQRQAQAAAGFDAALAQTARAIAAANNAGNKAEVQRLNDLFIEQTNAKNASLKGGQ